MELLVVIAIIAVLLALLMPTAEYVRFQAICSHCMANLRHWGTATNWCATDHNGNLPRFNLSGQGSGTTWDRGADFWPDGLAEYGIVPPMYFCPLDHVNVLFLDGRVEVRKRRQIIQRRTDVYWGGSTGVWW